MWQTMSKVEIDLQTEINKYENNDDIIIHIGTDAQSPTKNKVDYVTVVCVHTIGKGGRVFYTKDKNIPFFSLWEKLYGETDRSLKVAMAITNENEIFRDRIMVHVDAGVDVRYQSTKFSKQLQGMVRGYGFLSLLKPNAWAASHVADHIVKYKN